MKKGESVQGWLWYEAQYTEKELNVQFLSLFVTEKPTQKTFAASVDTCELRSLRFLMPLFYNPVKIHSRIFIYLYSYSQSFPNPFSPIFPGKHLQRLFLYDLSNWSLLLPPKMSFEILLFLQTYCQHLDQTIIPDITATAPVFFSPALRLSALSLQSLLDTNTSVIFLKYKSHAVPCSKSFKVPLVCNKVKTSLHSTEGLCGSAATSVTLPCNGPKCYYI